MNFYTAAAAYRCAIRGFHVQVMAGTGTAISTPTTYGYCADCGCDLTPENDVTNGGCHKGYKLISVERPTVYCSCTLGLLAKAMDDDPLDSYKAERWERVCRSRTTADIGGPSGG